MQKEMIVNFFFWRRNMIVRSEKKKKYSARGEFILHTDSNHEAEEGTCIRM